MEELIKIGQISKPQSNFYLKSEYAPISETWPILAYSSLQVKHKVQRYYQPINDFILTVGTSTKETEDPEHRSRLLSLVVVDKTKVFPTKACVSPKEWTWADTKHPGQWENAFKIIRAWSVVGLPRAADIVGASYSKMGHSVNRGNILQISESEKQELLNINIAPLPLPLLSIDDESVKRQELISDRAINQEAMRIAGLVYNRVACSGMLVQHRAPERTAPVDFVLKVAEMLKVAPLECQLCQGPMEIGGKNPLLKPSPDRIDSLTTDYGPGNFQLTHLACNLGKNSATVEQFQEWLSIVKDVEGNS